MNLSAGNSSSFHKKKNLKVKQCNFWMTLWMEICNASRFLWKLFLPLNYSDIGELRCNSLALQPSEDDVTVTNFTANSLVLSVSLSCGGCSSGCLVTSADKPASACISHHITHHSNQHYANDFINRWIFKTLFEWNKKADTFICPTIEWMTIFLSLLPFDAFVLRNYRQNFTL